MTVIATWRRAASLIAAGIVAAALSGCVVTSETNLVSADEAAQPLPASFVMQTYKENEGGGFSLSDDDPGGSFTLKDGGYVAPDDSLTAYFVGLGDNRYLLAAVGTDGVMYGSAVIDDTGIMELRMLLSEQPDAASLPAGVAVTEGGVMVANRADLDTVIAAIADGTLPTEPLLAFVGPAPAPTGIIRDGDWYRGTHD